MNKETSRSGLTIGETLILLRNMVDSFVSRHYDAWEKARERYEKERGFSLGVPLSMQSYIGSDLLIDFAFLARTAEARNPFKREYWIRSQGVQCIGTDEDREMNRRTFSDILGKISLEFDGSHFQNIHWVEDDDCRVKNYFIEEEYLYDRY